MPKRIFYEIALIKNIPNALYKNEKIYVSTAVTKRQREFNAGRWCARKALARAGGPQVSILPGEKREPIFPQGWVGSISHDDIIAIAVVAKKNQYLSISIDVETVGRVSETTWPLLFNQQEMAQLKQCSGFVREQLATLLFSAKECFYKLQYPLCQEWLDFLDVEVVVDMSERIFQIVHIRNEPAAKALLGVTGRYGYIDDHLVTFMFFINAATPQKS